MQSTEVQSVNIKANEIFEIENFDEILKQFETRGVPTFENKFSIKIDENIKVNLNHVQVFWYVFRYSNGESLLKYPNTEPCVKFFKEVIGEFNKFSNKYSFDVLSLNIEDIVKDAKQYYGYYEMEKLFLRLIEDQNKYCLLTFVSEFDKLNLFQIFK